MGDNSVHTRRYIPEPERAAHISSRLAEFDIAPVRQFEADIADRPSERIRDGPRYRLSCRCCNTSGASLDSQ